MNSLKTQEAEIKENIVDLHRVNMIFSKKITKLCQQLEYILNTKYNSYIKDSIFFASASHDDNCWIIVKVNGNYVTEEQYKEIDNYIDNLTIFSEKHSIVITSTLTKQHYNK